MKIHDLLRELARAGIIRASAATLRQAQGDSHPHGSLCVVGLSMPKTMCVGIDRPALRPFGKLMVATGR
jgi:hypothetical protein